MARCLFQHCNRRHWRLPWLGQSAYLPGDLAPWCWRRKVPCLIEHHQRVYCTHQPCLFALGQSWKGQGDHSSKQAGNKERMWSNIQEINWSFNSLKHLQALQSQKRSKPMARCSAVINSSTGFSHVVIIGSGLCGFMNHLMDFYKTVTVKYLAGDPQCSTPV